MKLGLTPRQATVYVALLTNRPTKPSQIAKVCSIERAEVYRIVRSLSQLGMVEITSSSPLECVARLPEQALSFRKRELEELIETERSLQVPLREIMDKKRSTKIKSTVKLIPHRLVTQRKDEMIQTAKKEILITSPMLKLSELLIENHLWERVVGDVQLKVLTNISEVDETIPRLVNEISTSQSLSEIRHIEELSSFFMIVDNAEILVESSASPQAESVDLWTDLACYILPFRDYFKKLWKESVNAQHRINILSWAKSIETSPIQSVT